MSRYIVRRMAGPVTERYEVVNEKGEIVENWFLTREAAERAAAIWNTGGAVAS